MAATSPAGRRARVVGVLVAGLIFSAFAGILYSIVRNSGPKDGEAPAPKETPPAEPSAFNFDIDEEELRKREAAPEYDYTPKPGRRSSIGFVENKEGIPGQAPASSPPKSEGAVPKILRNIRWAIAFAEDPKGFLYRNTMIGRPDEARAYLSDPSSVRRYLNLRSTKIVMNNPKVAQALLKIPGAGDLILQSPAAKDPEVIRALVKSGILDVAVRSPTGRAFLEDPGKMGRITEDPRIARIMTDPTLSQWMARTRNGQAAMRALGRAGRSR